MSVYINKKIAISLKDVTKTYRLYTKNIDRVKQIFVPSSRKKYYSNFQALKTINLNIFSGQVLGIVGKNGSGKSTLLQLICKTLFPDKGKITVLGRVAALLELGSGFNFNFSGKENIYIYAALLGLKQKEIDERYSQIVSFSELNSFIDQPLSHYSSGMVTRLAFSVAIHTNPDILIIDEALAVGDEIFQRKCFAKIEVLKDRGVTILFTSHSSQQILELCDRAILIDEGELLLDSDPNTVIKAYQKLIYAPASESSRIRKIILNSKGDLKKIKIAASHDHKLSIKKNTTNTKIFSLTPFEHESFGAIIQKTSIKNSSKNKTNLLQRGLRYSFEAKVFFKINAEKIRFGVTFKSINGTPIAGTLSSSPLSYSIRSIKQNSYAYFKCFFKCNLNPGTYFLNCIVYGKINGEEMVMHRIVDCEYFQVKPIPNLHETQLTSLDFETSISYEN